MADIHFKNNHMKNSIKLLYEMQAHLHLTLSKSNNECG